MHPGRVSSTRALLAVAIALIAPMLGGCEEGLITPGEDGSGTLVTETRGVDAFNSIEVGSAIHLDLVVDPEASQSVTVTYDDNIIDKVVTRVSGNTLVLDIDGSVNLTGGADRGVAITINELVSLESSGAANVKATGTASILRLDASGASNVDMRDLDAVDVELDASGASDVDVYATGTISGSASGASNLTVHGDPVSVLVDSSGASTVEIEN